MSNSLAEPGTSCLTCRVWSWGWICLASVWGCISRTDGSSRSVHVGFLLELTNVFLVSDSFIPKPVGNLSRQDKRKHRALLIPARREPSENQGWSLACMALTAMGGLGWVGLEWVLHRLVLWIHISARMEWLPITVSLCHRDCSYHQELTQAPISQHPLTPITANGLPDEARGVIPALMINNIKMRTLSILQSFRYKEPESVLRHYGRERKALQIIRPLRSGPGACLESLGVNEWNRLRRQFIPGWWIQNTNCCLPWRWLVLIINSHRIEWTWALECRDGGKRHNGPLLISVFLCSSAIQCWRLRRLSIFADLLWDCGARASNDCFANFLKQ